VKLPQAIPGVNCAAVVLPKSRKGYHGAVRDCAQGSRSGNPNVPMSAIVDAVCSELGVRKQAFESTSRRLPIVIAREMVAALATELTRLSYPAIAMAMNRPNHSTVIDARERWYARVERAEGGDLTAHIAAGSSVYEPQELLEKIKAKLKRTVVA
jgi:hypothetical protein